MGEEGEQPEITPEEEKFEKEIAIEINKLQFYLEDIDELIESQDIREITVTSKHTDEILDRLNELVLKTQEPKMGNSSYRKACWGLWCKFHFRIKWPPLRVVSCCASFLLFTVLIFCDQSIFSPVLNEYVSVTI